MTERTVGPTARHDRDSLLAVAVAVFTRRGYDGTSMADLSEAAGIRKSSFYHHVQSKEELLALALDRGLDALFAILDEPRSVEGSAVDRLEHVVRRTVEVLVAELPYVTLLLRVRGNTATERRALARRREFDRRVAELVAAAEPGGALAGIDPALVTKLVFGMINSIIEWYRPRGGLATAEIADAVVRLTLSGLRG